jgi:hypothetical protein
MLTEEALEALIHRYAPGQSAGEDLRYDDLFSQVKNETTAVSPRAAWILQESLVLLQRSADWRVVIYALHAAAMLAEGGSFVNLLRFYRHLAEHRWEDSYPHEDHQKMATFEWCIRSYIAQHLNDKNPAISQDALISLGECLGALYAVFEIKTGETLRWQSLDAWIQERREKPKPSQAPVDLPVKSAKEARPFLDEFVLTLLKEGQYERAIGLSRAHRWGNLQIPVHQNNKTKFELRQSSVDKIAQGVEKQEWKEVILASESFFLQPQAHFYFKLNLWSHQALVALGELRAAELILLFVKRLAKDYRQLLKLMYNSGQECSDRECTAWILQLGEAVKSPQAKSSVMNASVQWFSEQDVVSMKAWLKSHEIKTKKDAFMRDAVQFKVLSLERSDLSLALPMKALFNRSIDEGLFHWEPELAQALWGMYAGILEEEKKKHNNNSDSKAVWQAQWNHLTETLVKIHVPAALALLNPSQE